MKMLKNITLIFRKEFLQMIRNKSVLFTNFFLPFFGIPLYLIFAIEVGEYASNKKDAQLNDSTVFKIAYQKDIPIGLQALLKKDRKVEIIESSSVADVELVKKYHMLLKEFDTQRKKGIDLKTKVGQSDNELILAKAELASAKDAYHAVRDELKRKMQSDSDLQIFTFQQNNKSTVNIYTLYNDKSKTSEAAESYTDGIVSKYNEQLIISAKDAKGVTEVDLNPINVTRVNLNSGNSTISKMVGIGMGAAILFFLLIAIYNPAIESTIGEKANETYKILLMNPIPVRDIFLGKYLNVALQGCLTLIPYGLLAFVFYGYIHSKLLVEVLPSLSFAQVGLIFLQIMSIAILISAISFFISSMAKAREQAQALLTFLMLGIEIPIVIAGVLDLKLTILTAFLPLINFPVATENIMAGDLNYMAQFITLAVNLGLSLMIIFLSLNAFMVQWQGSKDSKGFNEVINFGSRRSYKLLPAHAYIAFSLAFVGYIYGSLGLSLLKIEIFALLFPPILFCLGPVVAIIWYAKMDHTKIFNWKAPKVVDGLKTVFAAILLSLVLNNLVQWLGLNQMLQVELPKLLMEDSLVGVLTSLTLIALIPGIVEELLFRGVIFKGLRSQYNFPLAAIISSVMFAAIHFSFFRLGHTFIAGLVLAYIYEKRSILSCFLFHITFNATAVLGSSITKLGEALTLELSFLSIIAVSIASIGIGYLIRLKKVPQSATEVIEENQKLVA